MNKIFIFFIAFFLLGGAKDKAVPKKEIINFDEKIREYYVSLPEDTSKPVPIIINFHGFLSHAMDQQGFSQMDNYAHQNGIGVIYPEGVKRSWNVGKAILNDENDMEIDEDDDDDLSMARLVGSRTPSFVEMT